MLDLFMFMFKFNLCVRFIHVLRFIPHTRHGLIYIKGLATSGFYQELLQGADRFLGYVVAFTMQSQRQV